MKKTKQMCTQTVWTAVQNLVGEFLSINEQGSYDCQMTRTAHSLGFKVFTEGEMRLNIQVGREQPKGGAR